MVTYKTVSFKSLKTSVWGIRKAWTYSLKTLERPQAPPLGPDSLSIITHSFLSPCHNSNTFNSPLFSSGFWSPQAILACCLYPSHPSWDLPLVLLSL